MRADTYFRLICNLPIGLRRDSLGRGDGDRISSIEIDEPELPDTITLFRASQRKRKSRVDDDL